MIIALPVINIEKLMINDRIDGVLLINANDSKARDIKIIPTIARRLAPNRSYIRPDKGDNNPINSPQ